MALGPFSKQDHMQITTLGLEFAVAEALGVWVGYWLDGKLGTRPWMLLLGACAGFSLGLYLVLRAAKEMTRDNANLKKERKDGRS